ncbi:hypothetical protein Pcinc_014213 [Petrolisthes cinctipes]|uniref:Uncharacterized protein n=1 Tax=Petrolisthes cinctipes TaxID=88211 RepID=A0AAE1FXG0_PETCI|nr:hypothetical protein Pcinc_014212 [Petrolisthes cinctipes]KAK3881341.1 hypothetical protein Pcinc_014213 [Petrolisthes cinctipes]
MDLKIVICFLAVVVVALAAPQQIPKGYGISDDLTEPLEKMISLSAAASARSGQNVPGLTPDEREQDNETAKESLDMTIDFLHQLTALWKDNVPRYE